MSLCHELCSELGKTLGNRALNNSLQSRVIICLWKKQLIYRCIDKSRYKYSYACWKKYFMYSKAMFISLLSMLWSDQATIFSKNVPDAKKSHSNLSCKEERLHEKYFGTTKTRKGTKYYIHVTSLPPAIYEKFQAVRDKVGTT